jgi:hypothetical protein
VEGALPDTYGLKAEELAGLLMGYLAQYQKEENVHYNNE